MAPRPEARGSVAGDVRAGGSGAGGARTDGIDVLVVSLGSTGGLRAADEELLASLRRAGASAEMARARPPRELRTLMLTDLVWARAARVATRAALEQTAARAVIYSSTTAALLWPRAGAIRFDAPAAANRPGRHGLWQRPLEARRLRAAPLLLPLSEGGLGEIPSSARTSDALVLPVPVDPSGPQAVRDIAALTYAANPAKKGLDRILRAWSEVRKPDEELVVAGASEGELGKLGYALPTEGVRFVAMLAQADYRALLRRARVFVCAARREDYGAAQLEALADGCVLVTTPSPGPYAALPIARELDARLASWDLAGALRIALDDPPAGYADRALRAIAPFRIAQVDRIVAEQLLPRLLA
jgi:glycosyltransferase involved in cell wall biosynthesis